MIILLPRIVNILLKHNANLRRGDIDGQTPLHYAAKYCDGCPRMIDLLLERYASHIDTFLVC